MLPTEKAAIERMIMRVEALVGDCPRLAGGWTAEDDLMSLETLRGVIEEAVNRYHSEMHEGGAPTPTAIWSRAVGRQDGA